MKKLIFLFAFIFSMTQIWSSDMKSSGRSSETDVSKNFSIPLIGEKAPSFTAESTTGMVNFPADYNYRWKIIFSHPQDFTPVCTSEILELANLQKEFDKLGVKLIVLSTDKLSTHTQWKKAMEEIEYKGRTPVSIKFPLVDDSNLAISRKYGMIHEKSNTTRGVRGVFVVDPNDIVRAIYYYPVEVGRSTDELLRTLVALQTVDKNKVMTPADWRSGNDVIIPYNPITDSKNKNMDPAKYYQTSWFTWYKKANK